MQRLFDDLVSVPLHIDRGEMRGGESASEQTAVAVKPLRRPHARSRRW